MSKVTLSMVYEEVKKLNKRMEFIEELVEEIIVNELPKIKLSKEEIEKIKDSLEEMRKGNYVTLKELVNA
jgi:coenzyme F420-reducing hydrogenase delta subunit